MPGGWGYSLYNTDTPIKEKPDHPNDTEYRELPEFYLPEKFSFVVVVYHDATIVSIGYGLLKNCWPMVINSPRSTHCREFHYLKPCTLHIRLLR